MRESISFKVRFYFGVLAGAACFLRPGVGHAATSEQRAAAEVLFTEGGQLFREGKFEAACQKLAQSQELDPAVGTQLNLARCYEKVGKTSSAWLAYVDAASAAKTVGQREREETARAGAARLEALVPKLLIRVPDDMQALGLSLQVTRDNQPVPRALWNVASPTDPGLHTIIAKAPNRKLWSKSVRLNPAEGLTITLPTLEQTAPEPPPREAASVGLRAQHVFALSAAAVGLTSIAVGSGLAFSAKSDADKANHTCSGSTCADEQGLTANRDALKKANLATVFITIGTVCLAGGAALWFTAPSLSQTKAHRASSPRFAGMSPVLEANLKGVLWEGQF